jgi:hypothetical protein
MAEAPEGLSLERHRDLRGRERRPYLRWLILLLIALLLAAGLANVFGQRPQTDEVESTLARMELYSPRKLRSGLYYESRFTIEARREIREATLVLDPGWLEGMTLNTLEPAPIGEASRNGRIALELGRIPAGGRHVFFLQFQVNPTNVGRRAADVELHDGESPLLRLDREVIVYP